MILHRITSGLQDGTFGYLYAGDQRFCTVEPPWVDNRPFESCVPPGTYRLRWLPTTTPIPDTYDGHTWYLEGDSVGIDEGHRTRIAIHIGNLPEDVSGCIAVGMRFGCVFGEWAVVDSRRALEVLRASVATFSSLIIKNPV